MSDPIEQRQRSFKLRLISNIVVLMLLILISLLIFSCEMDTPPEPTHTNPWDPNNPHAPVAPSGLTGQALTETSIRIEWQDQSGNEDWFIIREGVSDPENLTILDSLDADVTYLRIPDRQPATSYYYQVQAEGSGGKSDLTSVIHVSTLDCMPTRPDNAVTETLSATSIELSWQDNSHNENGFEIYESEMVDDNFNLLMNVQQDSTNVIINDRETFSTYYYKIRAINNYGGSQYTDVVRAIPGNFPPSAPSDLSYQIDSEAEVTVSWLDNAQNEENFILFLKENLNHDFYEFAQLPENLDFFKFTDFRPDSVYSVKVLAKNRFGQSDFSNTVEFTTANARPAFPADVRAQALTETEIELSWTDRSIIETGYLIEESESTEDNFSIILEVGENVETARIYDRTPLTTYYYRIRTIGQADTSDYSEVASVVAGSLAPLAPENLTGEPVGLNDIYLVWDDASNNEENFEIEERIVGTQQWETVQSVGANSIETDLYGRVSATTYQYRVFSVNEYGRSEPSNTTEITTHSLPADPSILHAVGVTPDRIDLTWRDNADNEDQYFIEQSRGSMDAFEQIGFVGADSTSFTVTGLDQFERYYYRVRAQNEYGYSHYSNIDEATPYTTIALAACGITGLQVVNVSNPMQPQIIGSFDTPGYARAVEVYLNTAYVADEYSLQAIDISDLQNPQLRTSYDLETRSRNLTIVNEFLYLVSDRDGGLYIFDISTPDRLDLEGSFLIEDFNVFDVRVHSNCAFLAAGGEGLVILNITNTDRIQELNRFMTPSAAYGIDYRGNLVFLANFSAGIRIIDVSNPDAPQETGDVDTEDWAYDITVKDNFAYIADHYAGLHVADIGDPSQPRITGTANTPDQAYSVTVNNNAAFVADDNGGMRIINVTNPSTPVEVSFVSFPGHCHGIEIVECR